MLKTYLAARQARALLLAARAPGGDLLGVTGAMSEGRGDAAAAARAVVRLRVVGRLMLGFLDPVEDAVYLTAGLRGLGFAASLQLGRELAPAVAPGGFHVWVECGGEVVSCSLPVRDEYLALLDREEPLCAAMSI